MESLTSIATPYLGGKIQLLKNVHRFLNASNLTTISRKKGEEDMMDFLFLIKQISKLLILDVAVLVHVVSGMGNIQLMDLKRRIHF